MGGGQFSLCQKIGLYLFSVCLFFCSSESFEKLGLPPEKKNGGKLWAGPPILKLETLRHNPTFSVTLTNSQVEESPF